MRVRKAIKKIASLGIGASFVGATVLGAMAADLANYPAPFVHDGMFDAFIVVGDAAAAEDVVGAVDIGASLQFSMKQELTMASAGLQPFARVSEGVRIVEGSNELNVRFEDIQDVQDTPLDESDLPSVLREALYSESEGETDNDQSYTQELHWFDGSGKVLFEQDDNDGAPIATDYLWFDETVDYMYTFELEFDDSVEFRADSLTDAVEDFESTTIELQGNDYTVTDVEFNSNGSTSGDRYYLKEVTLTAGDTVIWLTQDQTITKTVDGVQHEITIVDVSDTEDEREIACGVSVDGDVVWIDRDDTETINGVSIAVTDAKAVNAQLKDVDICEISIGASQIVLKHGDEIEIDGVEVDGSYTSIDSATLTPGVWDGINLSFTPEDDVYLLEGETWVDPIFGNFQVSYGGLSAVYEEITLTASGDDDAELLFVNNDGRQVEIPFYYNEDSRDIILGEDDEEPILQEDGFVDLYINSSGGVFGSSYADFATTANRNATYTNAFLPDVDIFQWNDGIKSAEGVMFWVVTSGREGHLLELQDVDLNEDPDELDIRDITYGKTYNDEDWAAAGTVELGGIGQIDLDASNRAVTGAGNLTATDIYLDTDTNGAETLYGADIRFIPVVYTGTSDDSDTDTPNTGMMRVFVELEEEEEDQEDAMLNIVQVEVEEDLTDDDIQFARPNFLYAATSGSGLSVTVRDTSTAVSSFQDEDEEEDDIELAMTDYGTRVTYDTDEQDYLKLEYPDQEAFANVFISPTGATTTAASVSGGATSVALNRLNVGAAKLASEVSNVRGQNLIVVGGPCANAVAAEVMGQSGDQCADGFEEGKGIVKLYESGDSVALVVAGWSALDTRRATRVLANFEAYDLSGSEVEVTGTSLEDISVGVPQ